MGSRILNCGTIVALLAAFVQAPFSHVHQHESTQHHPGGFFHTHFHHVHHRNSGEAELTALDPDEDAVFQQWLSSTLNVPYTVTVVLYAVQILPRPSTNQWRTDIVQPSSHDPPVLATLPPRSPPA